MMTVMVFDSVSAGLKKHGFMIFVQKKFVKLYMVIEMQTLKTSSENNAKLVNESPSEQ